MVLSLYLARAREGLTNHPRAQRLRRPLLCPLKLPPLLVRYNQSVTSLLKVMLVDVSLS